MKIIPAIMLMLMASLAMAQPQIMTKEERMASGTEINLEAYVHLSPEPVEKEIRGFLESSFASVLPPGANPPLELHMQLLVNEKGKIDYLIFHIEDPGKFKKDSLDEVLKRKLPAIAEKWELTNKPGRPVQMFLIRDFGVKRLNRQVRQTDSSVVTVPDAIALMDTMGVKRIFFNQLELQSLPQVIYRFPNAEELYLNANELKDLNIDFTRLPRLKQLHLQHNKLTNEGLRLSRNSTLEILNLLENKLTDIPDAARSCKKLSSLWLGGNPLSALSNRSFRRLKQLKDLNFYKSELTVLPRGIKKMRNLEVLDLYHNQFEKLPNGLTKLRKLTHLAISYNQLKTLPSKMDRLKNVHTLYAHHNRLSALPESMAKMQRVNILDLGFNWFTHFPEQVTSLKALQQLDISSNNFPEFPSKLLDIQKLDKLYLQGNPFVGNDMDVKYGRQLDVLRAKKVDVFY